MSSSLAMIGLIRESIECFRHPEDQPKTETQLRGTGGWKRYAEKYAQSPVLSESATDG